MKNVFFLKLAFGIIGVFGLLLAGFYFYEPVWFKIQEQRLLSDDPATVDSAAAAIASKGEAAIPHVRKWLQSENGKLVFSACRILEKMDGYTWTFAETQVETVASDLKTERAVPGLELLIRKKVHFYKYHETKRQIVFNMCIHLLDSEHENYDTDEMKNVYGQYMLSDLENFCPNDFFCDHDRMLSSTEDIWLLARVQAALWLGKYGGKAAVDALIRRLGKDALVSEAAAYSLGEIKSEKAVLPLIKVLEEPVTRRRAICSLGEIKDPRAVISIIDILAKCDSEDWETMCYIYHTLTKLSNYFPEILTVIGDSDYWDFAGNKNAIQWAKRNKSRLAWDAEKRKYYLQAERGGFEG